jgi:hypothetical protein
MIFTNVLINQLRGDKSRKLSAHEEQWKAQGSTLFCSSGRQGLDNNFLRNAAYSALLRAEQITREKSKFSPSLLPFDFNMDGIDEWLFQDVKINCYVQSTGGGIFELDYLPKSWNYLSTCSGRLAFADCLIHEYGEISGARLCYNEHYDLAGLDKVRRKLSLLLHRSRTGPFESIEIEKTYQLKKDSIHICYSVSNKEAKPEAFLFATQIDMALPGEGEDFTRFYTFKSGTPEAGFEALQSKRRLPSRIPDSVDNLKIHDIKNEVQIILTASKPFGGQIVPVYDNELFQAYCVMPVFPVSFDSGNKWEVEFTLKFSH